jgi:hypothetical protein
MTEVTVTGSVGSGLGAIYTAASAEVTGSRITLIGNDSTDSGGLHAESTGSWSDLTLSDNTGATVDGARITGADQVFQVDARDHDGARTLWIDVPSGIAAGLVARDNSGTGPTLQATGTVQFVDLLDNAQPIGVLLADGALTNASVARQSGTGLQLGDADAAHVTCVGNDVGVVFDTTAGAGTLTNSVVTRGGSGIGRVGTGAVAVSYTAVSDNTTDWQGLPSLVGVDGVTGDSAGFIAYSANALPELVDLHLQPTSTLVDAGDPATQDNDGTRADLGRFGGLFGDAASWSADSDGDGLPNGWEARYGPQDPNADVNGDGLSSLLELAAGTDPTVADTDGDGMSDGMEIASGGDPLAP